MRARCFITCCRHVLKVVNFWRSYHWHCQFLFKNTHTHTRKTKHCAMTQLPLPHTWQHLLWNHWALESQTFFLYFCYNIHRIKSLSDAADDLYNQFNTLKDNLAKLSNKFDKVEDFVDELQAGKIPKAWLWKAAQRPPVRVPTQKPTRASGRGQWVRKARARRGPGS